MGGSERHRGGHGDWASGPPLAVWARVSERGLGRVTDDDVSTNQSMASALLMLLALLAALASPATCLELSRRAALGACGCCFAGAACSPPAYALAQLVQSPSCASPLAPMERNTLADAAFARGMSSGMGGYERAVAPIKRRLFSQLFSSLPSEDAVVVELGLGTFPNAPYYAEALAGPNGKKLDVVGVDPNDSMQPYAQAAFADSGLPDAKLGGSTLRIVNGVAEAIPLADNSADAVVCTLTLCSVVDPEAALREVVRVLRPRGRLLFLEHVLSETDAFLAGQQKALTPLQVASADGCHLDRRTLESVKSTRGFASIDAEITNLAGFWYLSPTAAGLAVKAG